MSAQDVQATFAATLVDEWVRAGLCHAVICPGSRSTPMALALASRPELLVHTQHDERSGAFVALGIGRATGFPAVVVITSGTAAAELHPAVIEAHQAGVPMLVCTTDRPPELRDVGAPQTVDQQQLYGTAVRWYADPGVPEAAAAATWRALASRAAAETQGQAPGPVQLNLPFREPLVGTPGRLPAARGAGVWTATTLAGEPATADVRQAMERLSGRRGLVVAGEGSRAAAGQLAGELGWPLFADPRSRAWGGSFTGVPYLEAILRSEVVRRSLRPEVILRLGEPPASRIINEWCAASGADEIVVCGPRWSDPAASASTVVRADPEVFARSLVQALPTGSGTDRAGLWLRHWQAVSGAAQAALERELARVEEPNEPQVARDLVAAMPAGGSLVVSSSMPIRDVERYAMPRSDVEVVANRGANGIDGVVSTAVGVALGRGGPTGLLIGDLAFLHDSNGLLGAAQRDIDLVIVVVDNDGGGIFSFLPQARSLSSERFEQLFGTPHGLDLVAVAQAYGVEARQVGASEPRGLPGGVRAAFAKGGVHVLVVRTDRQDNVTAHGALDDAIARAVSDAVEGA